MENMSNFTKEEKDKAIKKELSKLRRTFRELEKDKMDTVLSLMKNIAFMSITLEDLQITMNRDGTIAEYQNGENQWGTKKSPEVEIYNTMIEKYMKAIKQLTDLLPKQVGTPGVGDDFEEFVGSK